jgi:hypothetical protein
MVVSAARNARCRSDCANGFRGAIRRTGRQFDPSPVVSVPAESARRGFGSSALKINGSIFAMLSKDRLVVKRPSDRVEALIRRAIQRERAGPFWIG